MIGPPFGDSRGGRFIGFLNGLIGDDENDDAEESRARDEDMAKVIERKHLGNWRKFGKTVRRVQGFTARLDLFDASGKRESTRIVEVAFSDVAKLFERAGEGLIIGAEIML